MLGFIYKKLNNRKGFSLIELIVVVGILGILAAVAIPRVTGSLATARANTDAANMRLIRGAIELAVAEGQITPEAANLTISWENADVDFTTAVTNPATNQAAIRTALARYLQVPPPDSQVNANGFTITITPAGVITVAVQ